MIHLSWFSMIFAAFDLQDLIPAGAITLMAAGLLMHYRKKNAQQQFSKLTPHEQLDKNRQMRGLRGDLEDVMVEIEQLAKRFSTQLDAKTIELEDLIQKADHRIAHLERLLNERLPDSVVDKSEAELDGSPSTSIPAPEPDIPDDPLARSVYQLADEGVEPMDIAKQLDEHIGKVELILALRTT